ncbi:MAG: helix-turn-helix domain-containing protein [Gammaproteobacteria bacterium]|nr:helix-turn-helix domain-containing protein [Gammaproteobacteria bacterium]
MASISSTDIVPPQERLNYWQEMVRDSYVSLEVEKQPSEDFFGHISIEPLGAVDISEIHSSRQVVHRTPRCIAHSEMDYFFVLAQMEGRGLICQAENKTRLDVGSWALIDTTRPFQFSMDDMFRQLVISIPRSSLPWLTSRSIHLAGRDLSQALSLGPVISKYLLSLSGQVQNIKQESRILLAESVINLICGALNESFPDSVNHCDSTTMYREQIKTFILGHLRDPDLSVPMIAAELNISSRYVHKLFSNQESSVSEYIRQLRLENCKRELISERNKERSITHIAFSWGFNSAAHFSYVFKQQFGLSASEYRRQSYANQEAESDRLH